MTETSGGRERAGNGQAGNGDSNGPWRMLCQDPLARIGGGVVLGLLSAPCAYWSLRSYVAPHGQYEPSVWAGLAAVIFVVACGLVFDALLGVALEPRPDEESIRFNSALRSARWRFLAANLLGALIAAGGAAGFMYYLPYHSLMRSGTTIVVSVLGFCLGVIIAPVLRGKTTLR